MKENKIIDIELNDDLVPFRLIKHDKSTIKVEKCELIYNHENEKIYRVHYSKDFLYTEVKLEKGKLRVNIIHFPEFKYKKKEKNEEFESNKFIYECFVDIGEILHKIGRKFDYEIKHEPRDYYSIVPSFIQIIISHVESLDVIVNRSLQNNLFDYKTLYFIMRSIYEMFATFDYMYTKYDDKERLLLNFYLWKLKALFNNKIETSSEDNNYKILNSEINIRINLIKKYLTESKYYSLVTPFLINKKTKKIEWEKVDWKLGKSYTTLGLETGVPTKLFAKYYGNLSNFVHSSNESIVTNSYFIEKGDNKLFLLNLESFFYNLNLLNIILINFSRKIEKFLKKNYNDIYSKEFEKMFDVKNTNEGYKFYSVLIDSMRY